MQCIFLHSKVLSAIHSSYYNMVKVKNTNADLS